MYGEMGRGAVRRQGGGSGATAGPANKLRDELGLVHEATFLDYLRILKPYIIPGGLQNRLAVFGCYVFLCASKACNMSSPYFLGKAVNRLMAGELPLLEIIAFSVLRFMVSVFEESQKLVYLRVKEAAYIETATDVFEHLHSLSLSWHLSKRTGAVLRAADRGIGSASTIVDMLVLRLVPTCIEAVVLVIVFGQAYGSKVSAIVLGVTFALYFALTYAITIWRTRQRQKANLADNDASQIWADSLGGFEVVKAFTAEGWELSRYRTAVAAFQLAARQSQASLVTMNLSQSLLMRVAAGGVMLAVAYDTLAGRADVGAFVALQTWVAQLFAPLSWLGMLYGAVMSSMTDMGNLAALLSEKPGVTDAPGARSLPHSSGALSVEFRGIEFSYPATRDRLDAHMDHTREEHARHDADSARTGLWGLPSRVVSRITTWIRTRRGPSYTTLDTAVSSDAVVVDLTSATSPASSTAPPGAVRTVLRDVSFVIPPGKTLAVVGATGSGKSTLARLLSRYYDAQGGQVLVGGQDVKELTQTALRSAIGLVGQVSFLFNDTIRFNIAYGKVAEHGSTTGTEVSQAAIEVAARAAHIHDFIMTLPSGYDTKVGERGLKLSGGEKQRVAIARAILKNPPILLLDEATSALDSLTEAEVQTAINAARRDRTVLVIAHRLSTIRDADEIVVLDAGQVIEHGTHEVLLAQGGKYAAMWHQQAAMQSGLASGGAESDLAMAPA